MAKLKLPPATSRSATTQINGLEIKTIAPENHTDGTQLIELLQKGLREGVFKGLSFAEDGKIA